MSTDNQRLAEFVAKYDLTLNDKLLKHLFIIAIDAIHKNTADITHKSIK